MTATQHLLIGLTGGIGSGKSTVADKFKQLGVNFVDADIVAREVVVPGSACLTAIVEHFGAHLLDTNGQLKRAALRQHIFSDLAAKQWLEALLHPVIRQHLLAQLAASKSAYTLLVAPLLLENGLNKLVHRVLVVDVSEQHQLARTMLRDSNNAEQVEAIIKSQLSRDERLAAADDIIDNNGAANQLNEQILTLHQKYMELSLKMTHQQQ